MMSEEHRIIARMKRRRTSAVDAVALPSMAARMRGSLDCVGSCHGLEYLEPGWIVG